MLVNMSTQPIFSHPFNKRQIIAQDMQSSTIISKPSVTLNSVIISHALNGRDFVNNNWFKTVCFELCTTWTMLCLTDSEMLFSQFYISKLSRNRHSFPIHARFPIGRNFKFPYNAKFRGLASIKSVGAKETNKCTSLLTSLCHRKWFGCSSSIVLFTWKARRHNMLSNDYPSCCKTTQPFSEIL